MRFNTLLLVAAVLALGFGLSFLLMPAAVLPLYGVEPAPDTVLMSRFFGAALFQWGLALYLLRATSDGQTRRGLVLAGVMGSAAGLVVALVGQLGGLINAMGWSTVAIYGVLLLAFASFLREGPVRV